MTKIPYRVERTHNRHSRAVVRDGTVIVRLARGLSAHEEQKHLSSLLTRIRTLLLRERKRIPIDPFRPLLEGATALSLRTQGSAPLTITVLPGRSTKTVRTSRQWHVSIGPRTDRRTLHRALWHALAESMQPAMATLVEATNAETLQVPIRSVRLRYARTQWGSCSARGDITLNPALLFLPPVLLRYVIIHELAHRLVGGHTARYWGHVARVHPDFQEHRRTLRCYRLPAL